MFSYSNLYLTFDKELWMVWITTKALKSGLKLRLKRFKNQKIPYPGKGNTPSPGPPPQQPWLFRPWQIPSTLLVFAYSKLLWRAFFGFNNYKSFKKWSENAFREVQNKKFPTQGKGTLLPQDPIPTALALWASPHTMYTIDVAYSNLLFRALYGFDYYKRVEKWSENVTREV